MSISRPKCFHCFKELMYVKGIGVVYETYVDPLGHSHKLHKECAKHYGYKLKPLTAIPQQEELYMLTQAIARNYE